MSLLAGARPLADEVTCLHSLAEFEYGKDNRFNNMAIALRFPNTVAGQTYAWDGERIWLVNKKAKVVKGVPINKPTESNVYLSAVAKTEIWNEKVFQKVGDGRTLKTISENSVNEVFQLFLQKTFTDFYIHKSMSMDARPRVMSACQRITTVRMIAGPDEVLTIADAVKKLWTIYQSQLATQSPEKKSLRTKKKAAENENPFDHVSGGTPARRLRGTSNRHILPGFTPDLPGRHSKRVLSRARQSVRVPLPRT